MFDIGYSPFVTSIRIDARDKRQKQIAVADSPPPLPPRVRGSRRGKRTIFRYSPTSVPSIRFIPSKIIDLLLQHDWPGNVRELENVMQRAVLMAKSHIVTEQEIIFDINPSSGYPNQLTF